MSNKNPRITPNPDSRPDPGQPAGSNDIGASALPDHAETGWDAGRDGPARDRLIDDPRARLFSSGAFRLTNVLGKPPEDNYNPDPPKDVDTTKHDNTKKFD
jgi:hypothetical protein